MSEKKQIINVKDLVIKADNVYIEPNHHRNHGRDPDRDRDRDHDHHDHDRNHKRDRDPFSGFIRGNREEEESSNHRDMESSENKEERRPFSWF